jgi:transcriptional regulator with XRE-family HTH domain
MPTLPERLSAHAAVPAGNDPEERADLPRLLASGPFPDALRAAIAESGLSLDRIGYRLRQQGTPISLATLSSWQSGRRRPERAASLAALIRLEQIVDVPPGSLAALLGPRRARGRKIYTDAPDLVAVYQDWNPIARLLSEFDTSSDDQLIRLSQYERLRVGPDGRLREFYSRALVRAAANDVSSAIVIDQADDGNPSVIHPLRGCTLGTVRSQPEVGLTIAELRLPRPLQRGELLVMEYRVEFTPPFPRDRDSSRRLRVPMREYVFDVEFTRPMLPERCVQFTASADESAETERVLTLDGQDRACAIEVDLDPCLIGVRWEWPEPPR